LEKIRRIDFFRTAIHLKHHLAASIEKKFDANLLIISSFILKSRFGILKFDQMAEKFKMAPKTKISVILLSKLQFPTDFRNLDCVEASFYYLTFVENFFQKSKMADFSRLRNF
jgi:hypothetical protein